MLLPQNTDPAISELTLHGEMADVYLTNNEGGKAIELLKQYNAGGHYNDRIGFILATDQNLAEDAVPFLSRALLQILLQSCVSSKDMQLFFVYEMIILPLNQSYFGELNSFPV